MGLALLAVIWLITLVSTYFFIAKTWWLPAGAAASAGFIDSQFALTYVLMGVVFWRRNSGSATWPGDTASAPRLRRSIILTEIQRLNWCGRC